MCPYVFLALNTSICHHRTYLFREHRNPNAHHILNKTQKAKIKKWATA